MSYIKAIEKVQKDILTNVFKRREKKFYYFKENDIYFVMIDSFSAVLIPEGVSIPFEHCSTAFNLKEMKTLSYMFNVDKMQEILPTGQIIYTEGKFYTEFTNKESDLFYIKQEHFRMFDDLIFYADFENRMVYACNENKDILAIICTVNI